MNLITHSDLINRGYKWLSNKYPLVLKEYHSYASETPDLIGMNHTVSTVIECKVSRSDFLHDKKKRARNHKNALGNYRYYLTLPHVVCVEDIREDWGLLIVFDNKIITARKAPPHFDLEVKAEERILLYSIARRVIGHGLLNEILKKYKG